LVREHLIFLETRTKACPGAMQTNAKGDGRAYGFRCPLSAQPLPGDEHDRFAIASAELRERLEHRLLARSLAAGEEAGLAPHSLEQRLAPSSRCPTAEPAPIGIGQALRTLRRHGFSVIEYLNRVDWRGSAHCFPTMQETGGVHLLEPRLFALFRAGLTVVTLDTQR
jgi:hypothetical protein